jgi:pyruvyltransferase
MIVRSCKLRNFGDTLNSELIRLITGNEPTIVNNSFTNPENETIYMCIGSVLGWADKNTIIWGTGKMSETDNTMFHEKPKKICAVRGKLTRDELIKRGYACPKIYGDPALLMPNFYKPKMDKKYDLSIIPHHIDKELIPILKKQFKKAHFIDITGDIYQVIDEICASERIASSALHGLICADAYDIPNIWIQLSDKVLGKGFKFRDYFSSVNRKDIIPLPVNSDTKLLSIVQKFKLYNKPEINLDKLWKVCPFKKEDKNEKRS